LLRPGRRDARLRPDDGPFLTLDQIRDEYARQVLADTRIDPNWLRDTEADIAMPGGSTAGSSGFCIDGRC
jgi:hypothetical protein